MAEAVRHDKTARQLRMLSDALDSGRLGPVRRLVNTLSPAEIGNLLESLPPGKREDLLAEMVDFNRRRAEKQPLTFFSAGSTFKRPEGAFAAQLIDECGLKGARIGGAQVSEKHAGFLINRGGTAEDFLALMAHVQRVVYRQKGVKLEPEIKILGEDAPVEQV